MKILTVIILIMSCLTTKGQGNERCTYRRTELIGIWHGVRMVEEPFSDMTNNYYIFAKKRAICFDVSSEYFYQVFYGFTKKKIGSLKSENELFEEGNFYVEYDYEDGNTSTPHGFELDSVGLETFNVYYRRIVKAPYVVLKRLVLQSKKNNIDYIQEFLEMDIREIISEKACIYNFKLKKIDGYLIKGDIIEVLSIGSEYIKFRYLKDDENEKIGFVKYSDISKKDPIPSFDCSKASTPTEKAICRSVELANLDLRLSKAYKQAKEAKGNIIQTEQRAWVKKRNQLNEPNLTQKLIDIYTERIEELR